MLCEQARDHLSAYLDRELASELSVAVRAHLESCADCRALLADLRATVGLLGRLPVHRAPADLADDVQREVERCTILPAAESGYDAEPQERTLALRRVRLWPRALAVAASVLLVVGIGVLALLGPAGGPETVPVLCPPVKHVTEFAKDDGIGVGSAAALAKKEAVSDYKADDLRDGGALESKEAGWAREQADLAKVSERARAGPSDLEHATKAPGPESLAEETDRMGRLRVTEKPSGDERATVLKVQMAMNQAANGEVPIDELKQVATVDNLRRIGYNNNLVIETDSPAEANKDLTRLFLANDWQPVAPPPAKADVYAGARVERLNGAKDKAGAPARVAARRARAAAPNGYYFLAHSDGEYVWVVIADRDYISRFSSQLAAAERLRVGNESGRQFQAIRTLQDEVRQYNLRQSQVVQGGGGTAGASGPARGAGEARYPREAEVSAAAPAVPAEAARRDVAAKAGTETEPAQITVGKAYDPSMGRLAQPSQAAEPAPAAPEREHEALAEESVAAKTRAEQERAGRDDALDLAGAAPSPPEEGTPAAPEPTPVDGEKAETPAAAQAIPPLQRPALAKEPAGPAPAGGEQKAQEEQAASRAKAATQGPAAPASKALAERERRETNGTFSYVVRLPANQDLLVIRVQRPGVSADVTAKEAAEDAAKPTVESGH
jgi:hypothetical protein